MAQLFTVALRVADSIFARNKIMFVELQLVFLDMAVCVCDLKCL